MGKHNEGGAKLVEFNKQHKLMITITQEEMLYDVHMFHGRGMANKPYLEDISHRMQISKYCDMKGVGITRHCL